MALVAGSPTVFLEEKAYSDAFFQECGEKLDPGK